jgi:nickel/cobalt transporter (NicO) family protein
MSLSKTTQARLTVALVLVAAAASMWLSAGHFDQALAQAANPFGGPRAPAVPTEPAPTGIMGWFKGLATWIFAKQAEFLLAMRAYLREAKTDGTALWGLLTVAFLYGVFHALGPGHGKAVISSYVVANQETWRRGVVLSFASALLQAVAAVVFVAVAGLLLNATMKMMCDAERVIEIASYSLIVLIGIRLLWVKGRGFLKALSGMRHQLQPVGTAVTPPHHHHHDDHSRDHHNHDHKHGHSHDDHHHGAHDHHHDHAHHHHGDEHASAWSHAHGPEPEQLAGSGGWRRGLSAVMAVGIRPCSGAIILLVFGLSNGLLWEATQATFVMAIGTGITVAAIATLAVFAQDFAKGVAERRSGYGVLAMRGIEVGASIFVIAFGLILLGGYMFSERLPFCR